MFGGHGNLPCSARASTLACMTRATHTRGTTPHPCHQIRSSLYITIRLSPIPPSLINNNNYPASRIQQSFHRIPGRFARPFQTHSIMAEAGDRELLSILLSCETMEEQREFLSNFTIPERARLTKIILKHKAEQAAAKADTPPQTPALNQTYENPLATPSATQTPLSAPETPSSDFPTSSVPPTLTPIRWRATGSQQLQQPHPPDDTGRSPSLPHANHTPTPRSLAPLPRRRTQHRDQTSENLFSTSSTDENSDTDGVAMPSSEKTKPGANTEEDNELSKIAANKIKGKRSRLSLHASLGFDDTPAAKALYNEVRDSAKKDCKAWVDFSVPWTHQTSSTNCNFAISYLMEAFKHLNYTRAHCENILRSLCKNGSTYQRKKKLKVWHGEHPGETMRKGRIAGNERGPDGWRVSTPSSYQTSGEEDTPPPRQFNAPIPAAPTRFLAPIPPTLAPREPMAQIPIPNIPGYSERDEIPAVQKTVPQARPMAYGNGNAPPPPARLQSASPALPAIPQAAPAKPKLIGMPPP